MTEAQKEIWLAAQMGGERGSRIITNLLSLSFAETSMWNCSATPYSKSFIKRHPILLASFSPDGQWQRVDPNAELEIALIDLSAKSEAERNAYWKA